MNYLLKDKYIAVEGKDNALKIAAALIEQDYQVFIQLDDCDIYIVAYTDNNTSCGGAEFALLDDEEQALVRNYREDKKDRAAVNRVKQLLDEGVITANDLRNDDDTELIKDDSNCDNYFYNDADFQE